MAKTTSRNKTDGVSGRVYREQCLFFQRQMGDLAYPFKPGDHQQFIAESYIKITRKHKD